MEEATTNKTNIHKTVYCDIIHFITKSIPEIIASIPKVFNIKGLTDNIKNNTGGFKKIINILVLKLFMNIIPFVIFVLTIVYLIINIKISIKSKRFFGDNISYIEIVNIYNVWGFYINEYVLALMILLFIVLLSVIYIYFISDAIDRDKNPYASNINNLILLYGILVFILFLYLLFFNVRIQEFGAAKENLNNIINGYINLDYLDYIDNLKSDTCKTCTGIQNCTCAFSDKNTLANLIGYLNDTIKTKDFNFTDFYTNNTDVEVIKNYTIDKTNNYKNVRMYDLIISAILTYSLIKNLLDNNYNDLIINKNFFKQQNSIFLSINLNKPNVFNIKYNECLHIFGFKANVITTNFAKECVMIDNKVNSIILKLKYKIASFPWPIEQTLKVCVFFIYVYYILKFIKHLEQKKI